MSASRICLRVVVSGRVQGVSYRAWTRRCAEEHGVNGWVRNLRDGRVEAVLQGDEAAVRAMLELMREGPGARAGERAGGPRSRGNR